MVETPETRGTFEEELSSITNQLVRLDGNQRRSIIISGLSLFLRPPNIRRSESEIVLCAAIWTLKKYGEESSPDKIVENVQATSETLKDIGIDFFEPPSDLLKSAKLPAHIFKSFVDDLTRLIENRFNSLSEIPLNSLLFLASLWLLNEYFRYRGFENRFVNEEAEGYIQYISRASYLIAFGSDGGENKEREKLERFGAADNAIVFPWGLEW